MRRRRTRFPFFSLTEPTLDGASELAGRIAGERVAYVLISDDELAALLAALDRADSRCSVVRLRDRRDRRASARRWHATVGGARELAGWIAAGRDFDDSEPLFPAPPDDPHDPQAEPIAPRQIRERVRLGLGELGQVQAYAQVRIVGGGQDEIRMRPGLRARSDPLHTPGAGDPSGVGVKQHTLNRSELGDLDDQVVVANRGIVNLDQTRSEVDRGSSCAGN